jgi:hypothetical protein
MKNFVDLSLGVTGWGYLRALIQDGGPRAVALRMRKDVMGFFSMIDRKSVV